MKKHGLQDVIKAFTPIATHLKNSKLIKHNHDRSVSKIDNTEQQSIQNIIDAEFWRDASEEGGMYYTFVYSLGVRVVDVTKTEGDDGKELLKIEADFEITYSSTQEFEEECIVAFSKDHVRYHVWPYWREYVQSSCARMGIGNINIPFYQLEISELVEQSK